MEVELADLKDSFCFLNFRVLIVIELKHPCSVGDVASKSG